MKITIELKDELFDEDGNDPKLNPHPMDTAGDRLKKFLDIVADTVIHSEEENGRPSFTGDILLSGDGSPIVGSYKIKV